MNKIKVVNNDIIPCYFDGIVINNNDIIFEKNGNYYIEYIDSNNVNLNINISNDVCISLFEYAHGNNILISNTYNIGDNGGLILSKFCYNNETNEVININLKGEKSSIKYNYSSVSKGNDRTKINIYHLGNNSISDIYNRTVAREGSSNYFDINSYVENGIKDCYLKQQTKIITLGESDNRINPNMFIGEDSTTAIHSSTISNIDEDSLFYLMSRGIDYNTSVKLIVKGFIISNINCDDEKKSEILNILDLLGGE